MAVTLEGRMEAARTVLWALAAGLAMAQGADGPAEDVEPELVAGGLDTLATMATGMAAEARTGKVAW